MRRVLPALVVVSLLGAAAPARAERPFGRTGTWLVGGGPYGSFQSERGEWEDEARKYYSLGFSTYVGWFFVDRLAMRAGPGFDWDVDEETDGTTKKTSLFFDLGPTAFFPIAGDDVLLLAGLGFGGERVKYSLPDARSVVLSGPRVTGDLGLALPVGTGGLVEVVGHAIRRSLTRTESGAGVDYDITRFSLGLRYSVVL